MTWLTISVVPLRLHLRVPFCLAHGTSDVRENMLVTVTHGDYFGIGEVAVVPYYGETPQRARTALAGNAIQQWLSHFPPPDRQPLQVLEDALATLPELSSPAARAALDMALHDLWGKVQHLPLYRLWGLDWARCPSSSFTIGMEHDETAFLSRLYEAEQHGIIKLKLGSGDPSWDLRLVQLARQATRAKLCLDANGAWTTAQAVDLIGRLAGLDILFVEQPVPANDINGWHTLRAELPRTAPLLIADESIQDLSTIAPLRGLVDGINIKLAKCGGLRPARQMIERARALKMKVMLGCMIESSLGITAAAHLAPLADFIDLDGNLLLADDPFCGAALQAGRLCAPHRPGLGVIPCSSQV